MTVSNVGKDIQTNAAVLLPQAARRQGLYIIGSTGQGKTGLIENLIVQDIEQGLGVCLLDPHGDLVKAVLSRVPERREHDVIYLDISDSGNPFGMNLFTYADPTNPLVVSHAASKVMHIFKKLWGKDGIIADSWGVLLEELLRNTTLTFLEASKDKVYTMAEIPLLLEDEMFRNTIIPAISNRHVLNYWLNKYNRLSDKDQREERRSTINRVSAFLTQPLVEGIVGQTRTTIDFRSVMDKRKILLIKLDNRLEDVTSLIGSLVIAELLDAAYSRSDTDLKKRKQFNIYADEFQRFATEDFATLLTEARKFGVTVTIAHQFRDQLDRQNKGATLNVANIVVFRVTPPDAQELAGVFDCTPPEPAIIGQRPILTFKQDVVNHMLKNGHSNSLINTFVQKFLVPAHTLRTQDVSAYLLSLDFWEEPKSVLSRDEITTALSYLNTLLYQAMTKKETAPRLSEDMLLLFSKIWGFSSLLERYYPGLEDVSVRGKWAEFAMLCEPDFEQHLEVALKTLVKQNLQTNIADLRRCITFLQALRHILHILAREPIMDSSGQTEPIYDKPRTYADVENEIASTLANLPKFTARVKILGIDDKPSEITMQTLTPERGIGKVALQERIQRIREQNTQNGYIRSRQEVEEELRKRQEFAAASPGRKKSKQEDV